MSEAATHTVLVLDRVSKQFGTHHVVIDFNLTIPRGAIYGLLGPNGAGKTTLIRMIMGLIAPSSGTITLFDRFRPGETSVRPLVGYMPQRLALYPHLTVYENILFFGRIYGLDENRIKERANELMDLVELTHRKNSIVENLSGGMAQRVMLATALIHRPQFLILDEPTAGVDPSLRLHFWRWFEAIVVDGVSILITTHHISEAAHSSKVIFIREGKLLEIDTPQALMQRYGVRDLDMAFVKATTDRGENNV